MSIPLALSLLSVCKWSALLKLHKSDMITLQMKQLKMGVWLKFERNTSSFQQSLLFLKLSVGVTLLFTVSHIPLRAHSSCLRLSTSYTHTPVAPKATQISGMQPASSHDSILCTSAHTWIQDYTQQVPVDKLVLSSLNTFQFQVDP